MRNYIDEIDINFVIQFIQNNILNDKINIFSLKKQNNAWNIQVVNAQGVRFEFCLNNFGVVKATINKPQNIQRQWRTALCKKFGADYLFDLRSSLNIEKLSGAEKEKLQEELAVLTATARCTQFKDDRCYR